MSPPIHTLIDEFKNVDFKKVELEYQDFSKLIELLPHLVNQDSKSNLKDISCFFGRNSLLQVKNYRLTRQRENEEGRVEENRD